MFSDSEDPFLCSVIGADFSVPSENSFVAGEDHAAEELAGVAQWPSGLLEDFSQGLALPSRIPDPVQWVADDAEAGVVHGGEIDDNDGGIDMDVDSDRTSFIGSDSEWDDDDNFMDAVLEEHALAALDAVIPNGIIEGGHMFEFENENDAVRHAQLQVNGDMNAVANVEVVFPNGLLDANEDYFEREMDEVASQFPDEIEENMDDAMDGQEEGGDIGGAFVDNGPAIDLDLLAQFDSVELHVVGSNKTWYRTRDTDGSEDWTDANDTAEKGLALDALYHNFQHTEPYYEIRRILGQREAMENGKPLLKNGRPLLDYYVEYEDEEYPNEWQPAENLKQAPSVVCQWKKHGL